MRAWLLALLVLVLMLVAGAARAAAPALTAEERDWLRTASPVVVGVQSDYAPFSIVEDAGRPAGYATELFVLAARKVGLRYRFARGERWEVLLPQAQRGQVDVLTCLWRLPERERFLAYVDPPYLHHAVGWAVRIDDASPPDALHTRGRVIAVVRDFAINDLLRRRFPDAMFVEAESAVDALRLVSSGKADAYIDNIGLVNYLDAQNGFTNVRVGELFELPQADYYMAVRRDRQVLRSVLAKGLMAVTEGERRGLEERWLRERTTFTQAVQPYLPRIAAGVVLFLLGVSALVYWNRRLRREVRLRREFERAAEAYASALEQRESFQRQLLDVAQALVLVLDGSGRWIVFNRFAEQLLGWRPDEVLGRRVPDAERDDQEPDAAPFLVHPEQARRSVAFVREHLGPDVPGDWRAMYALAELGVPPQRIDMQHRDGHRVPVLLSLACVRDARGQPAGLIIVANDLGAQVRLEDELRASEARAHEASHAKSAFLAAMSHEIRTPLIGVTGMVEVLALGALDPEQRRAVQVIQASSEALLQIVGDILDFSKIEAGRLELDARALDLRRLLRMVVANYSGSASSKGLSLSCAIDPRVAGAYRADPLRLRQILGNLLSNAIKFTAKGGVEAALEWVGESGDADTLVLRVTDTGIGVTDAQKARLFEPFAQADGETTRRFGGTGLGLAICRRLAELMGGSIEMDSVPGRGTTMRLRITLPRASMAEVEAEPDATGPADRGFVPRRLPATDEAERERSLVLLVDDHPTNRLVVARQLALAGFACETADDGVQALARWRSGRYALVLSDVHMPNMDGYALAQAIRADEAARGLPRTPIVALTAAALKDEASRCLAAGMDDFLAKPVGIATLAATLRRWMPWLDTATHPPVAPTAAWPQAGTGAVIDTDVLRVLARDAGEVHALLREFLASTDQDLVVLDTAQAAGDLAAIGRQAHRIKGAARLVGAGEIAATAEALEAAARAEQWTLLAALRADLGTAIARLRLYADAPA